MSQGSKEVFICRKCRRERAVSKVPRSRICFLCWQKDQGLESYVREDGIIDVRPIGPASGGGA